MIKSWKHKGLKPLFETGRSSRISKNHHAKILRILDALDATVIVSDMNLPGFDFHRLEGKPKRYSAHVNGNYCITFSFEDGDALNVHYEDYH